MFLEFLSFIIGKIMFFCSSVKGTSFPKPLTPEQEKEYLIAYKQNGDESAKEMLIKHNLRLVAHVAKKYQGADEQEDLISIGTIGLIKAINSYDLNKGTSLATYTARCVENEILMTLRSNKKYANTVLLSDTVGQDKDGNELTLIDLLSDEDDSIIEKVERKIFFDKVMEIVKEELDERQYEIMVLRYGIKSGVPLAQREVASLLKISRSYVSRIEKSAILKLRKVLKERNICLD